MKRILSILIISIYFQFCFSQTGTQIGNFLILNKCQELNGTYTDYYTVFSTKIPSTLKKIGDYLTSNSSSFTVSSNPAAKFVSGGCIISEKVCYEDYKLDGLEVGIATPSINEGTTQTIGNIVNLDANWRSLAWNFIEGTQIGPSNYLEINNVQYYPSLERLSIDGYTYSANKDQHVSSDWRIQAFGNVKVKLVVVKTGCE